jgi:hypothetical protein
MNSFVKTRKIRLPENVAGIKAMRNAYKILVRKNLKERSNLEI